MQGHKVEIKDYKRFLLFSFIIVLISTIGFLFWINNAIKKPVRENNPQLQNFSIEKGEGLEEISKNLEEEGIISNRFVFVLYLKLRGLSGKIQAGPYWLPIDKNMIEIAGIITKGQYNAKRITIPEGWTLDQVATYLNKELGFNPEEFKKEATVQEVYVEKLGTNVRKHEYDFLADVPVGTSLEGFLYPDTYELTLTPTPEEVVNKMLTNFGKKYTPELKEKAKAKNLSIYELITFASIVEREVSKAEDRKMVAGVFWNRYNIGMKFESDATIQYILRSNVKTFTYAETKTVSPYNTYLHKGLPKGPIANPGIDSIKAVLDPEESDYLFFLSANNVTYFSKTLEEHESKKYRYLK